MNIFNIPRAFGVSGFGEGWNVGKHSVATAILGLFWAKFNGFSQDVTYKLVTLALVHDMHEAVTGDILPMFKSPSVKEELDEIQNKILAALNVEIEKDLEVDLKIIDLIAFLYEIKQVSPSILQDKKLKLAKTIAARQRKVLFGYCDEHKINRTRITKFLSLMEI